MQQSRSNRPKASGSQKTGPNRKTRRSSSSKPQPPKKVDKIRKAPVALGRIAVIEAPKFKSLDNGDTRIIHREYLGEVVGSSTFTSTSYRIQPGNSKTFPWLSTIASNYEKYRFNKLRFHYETDCSTATPGTVMLIPDFDSSDAAPTTKVQALAYKKSARGQAWTEFSADLSGENLHAYPQYFVAQGVPPAGTDVKLYQVGNMFLCVSGFTATPTVGELWVEYDITLITPDSSLQAPSENISATVGTTSAAPLGTAPVLTGPIDVTIGGVGTTITFNQAFQGMIVLFQSGTVITAGAITLSSGNYNTIAGGSIINAAATILNNVIKLNAVPGDILTITSTATTITACSVFFASGSSSIL
jgi:hypothetical protein